MTDPRITDEATEAAAHSLRQFDAEGQFEPGELGLLLAYRDAARGALEAGVPLLAPQPVDREAVAQALFEHDQKVTGRAGTWKECGPLRQFAYLQRADAVLALLNGGAK